MRTPEQGHTKACLAKTMIAVIENMRDDPNYTDVGYAIDAGGTYIYHLAFDYLQDGTANCICPPDDPELRDALNNHQQ
jgi:hypothetical protein